MIEFILSMVGLAVASYAVWMSSGVTSCQRHLKSIDRRVNALCSDVMECQIKMDTLEREDGLNHGLIKDLSDRVNGEHESIKQDGKLFDTMIQEIRGDLSVTNVSVEELKIQLIKYQAEQQRIQSAMKENRDALVKWFGGEL